jgi:hypothetical protein
LIARIRAKVPPQSVAEGLAITYGVGTAAINGYAGLLKAAKQSLKGSL